MSVVLLLALLALAGSLLARRRRARARLGLDDWALALTLHLGLVAGAATCLAWLGLLAAWPLAFACVALALGCWPWTASQEPGPSTERRFPLAQTVGLLLLVAVGVGLRSPPISAPLAGRDQGSYQLRAAASVRTGAIGWTDATLAEAGRELTEAERAAERAAGPVDLLGLYPSNDEPWRAGRYEAAYRPGAYLGDREAGEVVPQFFHLHPMSLAATALALGPSGALAAVTWASGLWLLLLACCARRLWPTGPWAGLAVVLVAGSPLAIWTGRTPLSENPMAALEWAAVLVALRLRDGSERPTGAWWLAAALALAAGVRGNALLLLPIVLAIAWLRPRGPGERAPWLILAGLVASVTVHALTSYPYVHDELLRRLPGTGLGPASLITLALFGALAWRVIDRELARVLAARPASVGPWVAALPRALGATLLLAFVLWWSLRSAAPPGRPWARLDAAPILLGLPWLGIAAMGVVIVARRWRPRMDAPGEVWALALATLVPCTALLYAPRELPTLGFFYYGRYLVPELLPAAALLATAAVEALTRAIAGEGPPSEVRQGWRRPLGVGVGLMTGAGLLASVVGPLLEHPQLRLREYAAAEQAVAYLAARLPAEARVIAGGEGWHHGHTHNQVGGALAMGHGVEVLPYRTREDAWLTAWELLVAGPERRQQPAPPVFLLVNEAAHQHTRPDGTRVALLDDLLWAPFVLERASLLELFVHALTPVADQLPTRVARHELRMALLRVTVDPAALAAITTFDLDAPGESVRVDGPVPGQACVAPEQTLRIELPRPAGARHLVIETAGAAAERVPRWRVRVDGRPVASEPPEGLRPRPRASLGPLPIPDALDPSAPLIVELTPPSLPPAAGAEPCGHGRVRALRLLPRERGGLDPLDPLDPTQVETHTIVPSEDFGQPLVPTAWVSGRSLSRYRPGTRLASGAPLDIAGLALVLPAGDALEFAPVDLHVDERGQPRTLDVIVTLAGTTTPEGAALRVLADERELGVIPIPAQRRGSWVSPPLRWTPSRDRAAIRVELVADDGRVELRDLALFGAPG